MKSRSQSALLWGLSIIITWRFSQAALAKPTALAGLAVVALLFVLLQAQTLEFQVGVSLALIQLPLIPAPLRGVASGSIVAILISLRIYASGRCRMPGSGPAKLVAGLSSLVFLVSTANGDLRAAFPMLIACLSGMFLISALAGLQLSPEGKRLLLLGVTCGLAVTSALSLLAYTISFKLPGAPEAASQVYQLGATSFTRYGGILTDYELFAEEMTFTYILGLYLSLVSSVGRVRLFGLATALSALANVALTGTRVPVLLCLLATVTLLVLTPMSVRKRFIAVGSTVLVGLVGGPMAASLSSSSGLVARNQASGGLLASLYSDRIELWRHFLQAAGNGALTSLVGHGVRFPNELFGYYPHSLPLTLLYTVGIVGAALWAVALFVPLLRAVKTPRRGYCTLVLSLLIVLLLDQLKVEFLRLNAYVMVVCSIVALAWNLTQMDIERESRD